MKALRLLLFGLLVLAAGCSGGEAACGATYAPLKIEPKQISPGDTLRLRGEGFIGDCPDTGVFGRKPSPPPSDKDIQLTLRQAGKSWDLGSAQAREGDYIFTQEVRVPAEVRTGRAKVVASGEMVVRRGSVRVVPARANFRRGSQSD